MNNGLTDMRGYNGICTCGNFVSYKWSKRTKGYVCNLCEYNIARRQKIVICLLFTAVVISAWAIVIREVVGG